jgi:cell division protein FtsI/penicillin-binding protein 2
VRQKRKISLPRIERTQILKWFFIMCAVIIAGRLFQLQIMNYDKYNAYAKQRVTDKVIPARRGRILLNENDGKYFELVSNVSLDLLFADPKLIENPAESAKQIAPILFQATKNQNKACGNNERCLRAKLETELISQKSEIENRTEPLTEAELLENFTKEVEEKLGKKERDFVLLKSGLLKEILINIQDLKLDGIFTKDDYVYANPLLISNPKTTAEILLQFLSEYNLDQLEFALTKRPNRYIKIQNKLDFDASNAIKKLNIKGLGLTKEHWRNYSEQDGENTFAAQLLGFIDHGGNAAYGIEKSMDDILRGREGVIRADVDVSGRTLTSRLNTIQEAQNGNDVILTIDHVIQNTVEEYLKEQVIASQAMSGEVVITEPKTGRVIAMATYPTFNPNKYGEVYEKEEIFLNSEEQKNIVEKKTKDGSLYYLYYNPGYFIEIFKKDEKWLAYKNREGIRAYRNPIVSDFYEPGSVFKAIAMAAAIDAKEVTPQTIYHDIGPVVVDNGDFTIKNATNNYFGTVTMVDVLAKSLNTGMQFVAKKLGPATLHEYLKNFGFGERTNIELTDEEKGVITYYRRWLSESDLVTKAFGQGIAATPIQVVNAIATLANGGLLMQPYVVDGIIDSNGKVTKTEPQIIRKVISPETSKIITAMMVSVVEISYSKTAKVPGYKLAGKTGTSQIATRGLYEKGDGTTIASMGGFGPINDPKFAMLIKINRPRASIWGETNASPLFKKIAEFLLNYYHVQPDDPASLPQ